MYTKHGLKTFQCQRHEHSQMQILFKQKQCKSKVVAAEILTTKTTKTTIEKQNEELTKLKSVPINYL